MSVVYDELIAPKLMECAKLCEANGIPFVCYAQDDDGVSRTAFIPPGSAFGPRLVELAAQANGNVDSMMIALIRHAREHGPGSSIFLHRELNKE